MPRGLFAQPWVPQFGTGAPGANVSTAAPYFDKSTNPYTSYIWNAATGLWNKYAQGGVNATKLQGVNVKSGTPSTGHQLTYVSANTDWE